MVVRSGAKFLYWSIGSLAKASVAISKFVICEVVRGFITYSITAKILYQTNASCFVK